MHPDHPDFPFSVEQVRELMSLAQREPQGQWRITWGEALLCQVIAGTHGQKLDAKEMMPQEGPRDRDAEIMAQMGVRRGRNRHSINSG